MIKRKPESDRQSYRERIHMVRDIILKLVEYGEINQTALISFCGLNTKKHRSILQKMEENELITRTSKSLGKRSIAIYTCTPKGNAFCKNILEPYEKLFPRAENLTSSNQIVRREHGFLIEVNPILIR